MAKNDPDLSLLFHALADPTRLSILTRLADPTGLRLPQEAKGFGAFELGMETLGKLDRFVTSG